VPNSKEGTMGIKRFEILVNNHGNYYVGELQEGRYIEYSDYQTLESQLKGITKALDSAKIDMDNDSLLCRVITLREGCIYSQSQLSAANEIIRGLREALEWLTNIACGIGKAGSTPESGEFEEAVRNAQQALSSTPVDEEKLFGKMRGFTKEESEAYEKSLDKLFTPVDEERKVLKEALECASEHNRIYLHNCPMSQTDWNHPEGYCHDCNSKDNYHNCWMEYFKSKAHSRIEGVKE
jgi:hypothetical protein